MRKLYEKAALNSVIDGKKIKNIEQDLTLEYFVEHL